MHVVRVVGVGVTDLDFVSDAATYAHHAVVNCVAALVDVWVQMRREPIQHVHYGFGPVDR